jgi:hypothetical protein
VPFVTAGKPVFNVEYKFDAAQFCGKANAKDSTRSEAAHFDAWRVPCRGSLVRPVRAERRVQIRSFVDRKAARR